LGQRDDHQHDGLRPQRNPRPLSAQLACELRSVNHRFLEAGFRLPEELRALESELRQRSRASCGAARSTHLYLSASPQEADRASLVLDRALVERLAPREGRSRPPRPASPACT
jgi:uncharacterized protein YicC (UPF0701 family)